MEKKLYKKVDGGFELCSSFVIIELSRSSAKRIVISTKRELEKHRTNLKIWTWNPTCLSQKECPPSNITGSSYQWFIQNFGTKGSAAASQQ